MVYSTTYLTDLANSRVYRASPPPALALTCKLIYRDSSPLFRNLFAIHVMPARWGLRIGMGGYSRPSPAESDGIIQRWHPSNPLDGGGLVLTHMTKCIIRMNDPEMEGMDSLADFFAQVVSNAERERTKPALWDADRHRILAERGTVPMNMEYVLPPPPPGTLPTTVRDGRTRRMRGMGALMPGVGPSKGNGLGKAAEGVRELVFEWAPIKTPGWRKVVPEGLEETRAEQGRKIQERFLDLVVGMDSLEVLRLRGDCPGWWKGYLEEKIKRKILEKKKVEMMEKLGEKIKEMMKGKREEKVKEKIKDEMDEEIKKTIRRNLEKKMKEQKMKEQKMKEQKMKEQKMKGYLEKIEQEIKEGKFRIVMGG